MVRTFLRTTCWVLLVALAACARGNTLQGRIGGLGEVVQQAERNGAYRCAPRELALAKAHLRFARTELAQGQPEEGEDHLVLAEPNAHAAYRLSPPDRCAPRGVSVAKRKAPGDRDGDGILDPDDECPDEPEDFDAFEDEDGCPEDQDTDGDGVPDSRDLCMLEPEDVDGYLDTDGCPEPDNDLDGILDDDDECPNDPEDFDGWQDEDGCPEPNNDGDPLPDLEDECPNEPGPEDENGCPRVYEDVEVTTTHIRIRQKIHFEFNKAKIRPVSYGILDTVAEVLEDYPEVRVEVQGHTDSRGSDKYNQGLSEERAGSVRKYLIDKGIDPSRMVSRGYGESQPIESNRTAAGRAANRRVEFKRIDEGAQDGNQGEGATEEDGAQ
ncbi:MAG: OmpA family protein [Myxococcota bacterium]